MNPLKAIKKLFAKPKAVNKVVKKIRFKEHTWASLEKPPPDGICCVAINEPIQVTKHMVLAEEGTDDTFFYFRVFNPFLAVNKEAPDLCVIRISKYRLKQLSKNYKRL